MRSPLACASLGLVLVPLLAGPTLAEPSANRSVRGSSGSAEVLEELAPGFLPGYLSREQLLDSRRFVLPAPEVESARQLLDSAWSRQMVGLANTQRWQIARKDANLSFPVAADAFTCALGFQVDQARTPTLYTMLRRTLTDIGLSSYSAKTAYQRERPFMVGENIKICTPEDEDKLRKDGSYPSGHTAIGWGWALILAELVPDRAEEILARGRAFGESRNVCNVHWYSDVVAGRLVGAGVVARLHASPEFQADMNKAKQEISLFSNRVQANAKTCRLEQSTFSSTEFR